MHTACPLTAVAPEDAVRLDTSPPIAGFQVHKVSAVDRQIMVEES
jgi:hypothetical protein